MQNWLDADFPGGNIIVDGIEGDRVLIRPDLRDSDGNWFYWYFRVNGAAGRTLTFQFPTPDNITNRGPGVSTDGGWAWRWLSSPDQKPASDGFTYAFPADAGEVRFSVGMPYTQMHFEAFLKRLGDRRELRQETLCESRKGRAVERLHIGRLDEKPAYRVVVTARHHASEMMPNYAIEGLIEATLADDAAGRWMRENVEMLVVPFMDKDGVEDGDQGKKRAPRDHNRDYIGQSLYRETAAMRELLPAWSQGKAVVAMDLHCPWVRYNKHEVILQVITSEPHLRAEQERFGKLLEKVQEGPLVYRRADDLVPGMDWNGNLTTTEGSAASEEGTFSRWAGAVPEMKLATSVELPYANASGREVNQDSARAFGRSLGRAIQAYLAGTSKP